MVYFFVALVPFGIDLVATTPKVFICVFGELEEGCSAFRLLVFPPGGRVVEVKHVSI